MKQTAVQWLFKNLLDTPISNEDIIYNISVFEEAKEMENRQIVDAYDQGIEDGYNHPEVGYTNKFESSDDYFNKTFKKE
jgi:hypothetical protein